MRTHSPDARAAACPERWLVAELARRKLTLVTAESCTGGLIAKRLTDQPGASAVFQTGLITYANSAKTQLLGVPEALLLAHGAVSPQVAEAMACGARQLYGGDLAVAVTGIAGPSGGTTEKPVGLVWLALSTPEGCQLEVLHPPVGTVPSDGPSTVRFACPERETVRQRAADAAFGLVRRYLESLPG